MAARSSSESSTSKSPKNSHGFVTGALFLLIGMLYERRGVRDDTRDKNLAVGQHVNGAHLVIRRISSERRVDRAKALRELRRAVGREVLDGAIGPRARGVAFLVDENAGFVTGSTLSINGGQHMY